MSFGIESNRIENRIESNRKLEHVGQWLRPVSVQKQFLVAIFAEALLTFFRTDGKGSK